MSVFRPSVRVTDPQGRRWEIYLFRLTLPDRPVGHARLGFFRGVFVFFVRAIVDLPTAALHATRSDEWKVEAVSWAPYRRRYTWATTPEYRGQVLAQVEGGLARGEIPHPRNAHLLRAD